jgi:flagellar export protein FliJ
MRPFKFRAQVVLDLRKRQDDEAQRKLAIATRERAVAETRVDAASTAVEESMQRAREALESRAWGDSREWHRNWIVSRRKELAVQREGLAKSRAAEQLARQRAGDARRALRSLERWFERAWRRHQQALRRFEQRELDEVGAMRHVAQSRAQGRIGTGTKRDYE